MFVAVRLEPFNYDVVGPFPCEPSAIDWAKAKRDADGTRYHVRPVIQAEEIS